MRRVTNLHSSGNEPLSSLPRDRYNRVRSSIQPYWIPVLLLGIAFLQGTADAEDIEDPTPPKVTEVPADTPDPKSEAFDRVTYHADPKALHTDAVTADWPRYLGPNDDMTTPETHLLETFPDTGPAKVWEMQKGTGYTSPAIAEGKLVLFDRLGDNEHIDCLDPETGERFWHYEYPVEYTDRYGFSNGPRSSAVIDSGKVYTLGVRSVLSCLDLRTGTLLWQRNLKKEFEVPNYFFGHGACPLVYDGKVIINLGGKDNICVAAFDQHTGQLIWGTKHEWEASYAAPIVKTMQGKPRLLVFAGGESDPATGGLLCIDPDSGELHDAYPWRAPMYTSVNGQTPVVSGDLAYVSDAYVIGGVLLKLTPELKWEEFWKAPDFGMHWTMPLLLDGNIVAFRGRNEPDAWLASYNVETGKENWREDLSWKLKIPGSTQDYSMKYLRGALLQADGRIYALGELGSFGVLKVSEEGVERGATAQLFMAPSTWSPPVISNGLLYIAQHNDDRVGGEGPRLICYDLRSE